MRVKKITTVKVPHRKHKKPVMTTSKQISKSKKIILSFFFNRLCEETLFGRNLWKLFTLSDRETDRPLDRGCLSVCVSVRVCFCVCVPALRPEQLGRFRLKNLAHIGQAIGLAERSLSPCRRPLLNLTAAATCSSAE